MRALAFSLLSLFTLSAFAHDAARPTTILLVRHAEAGSEGSDPDLTEKGRERAKALAEVAKDAGVTAIYTSQLKRTQQTAAVLAETAKITPAIVQVERATLADHPADMVARIMKEHPGETVLVVGHSNTIPLIAEALLGGKVKVAPIEHTEYDRLLIVLRPAESGHSARLIAARYGP